MLLFWLYSQIFFTLWSFYNQRLQLFFDPTVMPLSESDQAHKNFNQLKHASIASLWPKSYLFAHSFPRNPVFFRNCVQTLHLSPNLSIDVWEWKRDATTIKNVPHVPILYSRITLAIGATKSASQLAKLSLQLFRGKGLRRHVPPFDMSSRVQTSFYLQPELLHRWCSTLARTPTLLRDVWVWASVNKLDAHNQPHRTITMQ